MTTEVLKTTLLNKIMENFNIISKNTYEDLSKTQKMLIDKLDSNKVNEYLDIINNKNLYIITDGDNNTTAKVFVVDFDLNLITFG